MNRRFRRVMVAAAVCVFGAGGTVDASPISLSFNPLSQTVTLGSEATVEVLVSGVMPEGLGAYDFDVIFDPALLTFDRAIDGGGLGSAIGLGTTSGVGRVTVSDFSFETIPDLLALQRDSFTLFSLVFDTLDAGTSPLRFDTVTLGDAAGSPVTPTALGTGSITVTAAVPEPGSLILLLTGALAGMAPTWRRLRKSGR